jgi:hypothetical protein
MLIRSTSLVAGLLVAAAVVAGPAQSQTEIPAPNVQPGACQDQVAPTSKYTSRAARRAKRTRLLRGTARDVGCGLDRVEISVARKVGRKCRYLAGRSKLSRRSTSCGRPTRWLKVKGTTHWAFRFPKRLPKGSYVVRTRATDFAGNVEHLRSHRIGFR